MNPVVIILPEGPTIGGVNSWARTLGGALAGRGRPVTLLIHGRIAGHQSIRLDAPPGVEVVVLDNLPTPRDLGGELDTLVEAYKSVATTAADRTGKEALLVPTRDADCFAVCAMLAARGDARLIGWRHSPMAYESAIFERYGAAMTRMLAVSTWLRDELRCACPQRATDIGLVPNGVPVPPHRPSRQQGGSTGIIYTGRLDEPVKRISALLAMSAELNRRGVRHQLTIAGDGPAAASVADAATGNPSVCLAGAVGPAEIGRLLEQHDIFVLGSRMEGLSLSALEAMAAGCALVLTNTPSGAADLVGTDEAGTLARVPPEADHIETGLALADGIERVVARGAHAIGRAAHARAQRLFSIDAMTDAAQRELDLASRAPLRTIEPVAPFHNPRNPASVPPDAGARLRSVLAAIASGGAGPEPIIIHGLGAHTTALAHEIAAAGSRIVAFTDDDPARYAQTVLGLPVVAPEQAGATGARHVIISSWMHEPAIWARRAVYERQGLTVWRLYVTATRAAG